ncbi:DUF3592 domain-containing protein [Pararobbsia silviterrae]|nr:DUF3592 domain-containing protein [Pararobbsia silviterrae]
MTNMSALRIVSLSLALTLSVARLALWEHWHISFPEFALIFAAFAVIAFAIRGQQSEKRSTEGNTRGPAISKKRFVLGAVFFIAMSFYVAYMGGRMFYVVFHIGTLAQDEQSWPMTDATIEGYAMQSMQQKNVGLLWSPAWTYTYSVGGQTYRSQSMALTGGFSAHWYRSKNEAALGAQLRADGSVVTAYYDPADPSRSVLDKRASGNRYVEGVALAFAVVIMLFPVGIVALFYVAWKQRNSAPVAH